MNATNLAQHYLYEEEARIVPAMMQGRAGQTGIAVRVINMPMRIDELGDQVRTQTVESRRNSRY